MLTALLDPLSLVRGIHFAASIWAAGTIAFMALVLEPVVAPRAPAADVVRLRAHLTRMAWTALALAVASQLAWLAMIAAAILNVPVTGLFDDGGLWTVASETRFGRIMMARTAIALGMAIWLLRGRATWPLTGLAAAFVGLIAWTGHAGAAVGAGGDIHLVSDLIHLVVAGAWVGSLPALALYLAPQTEGLAPTAPAATARFSTLGIGCVVAILGSGLVNSWFLLGDVADLVTTPYGRLVGAKLALFGLMLGIAVANRFWLTPRLPTARRALARNVVVEIALGLAAILVAGTLGIMPPTGHVHKSSAVEKPAQTLCISTAPQHSPRGRGNPTESCQKRWS